jgi:hypothetical protein
LKIQKIQKSTSPTLQSASLRYFTGILEWVDIETVTHV